MNLLLIAAAAAGVYAYNKNENFKEKANKAGEAISDLAKVTVDELKAFTKKEEK